MFKAALQMPLSRGCWNNGMRFETLRFADKVDSRKGEINDG